MKQMNVSCITLLALFCKMSLQSPFDLNLNKQEESTFLDNKWYATDIGNQRVVREVASSVRHRRVKRFQGGVVSNDPFVGIIYRDNGTRIHPHDPILFHGIKDIHLTREQLIWERIYQILRKRGSTNVPAGLPDQTRSLLLQCIQSSTRSQTSSRSSLDRCSNLSQGSGIPPGAGGFQHSHPGFEPYFPSNNFGTGNGFSHSHQSQTPSLPSGFNHGSSGHHHGPHGDTRPNIPFPNRYVNSQPFGTQFPSHQSSSGHLHGSQGNNGPPIFFG